MQLNTISLIAVAMAALPPGEVADDGVSAGECRNNYSRSDEP